MTQATAVHSNMGAYRFRRGMPELISMGQMSVTAYQSDKTTNANANSHNEVPVAA